MGRSRYKIFDNGETEVPYFLTCTVLNWLPLFSNPSVVRIVLDSLTFLQNTGRLILYAYVSMENHLHLVAASANLAKEIGDFKSYTARMIIDFYKASNAEPILRQLKLFKRRHKRDRPYQFWQEGSHPEQIQSAEMMVQKIMYLHNNPVKRGYVDDPVHWRYSSARNYAGLEALIRVTTKW
ncbi:MAG: transposase [bacterium]